MNNAKRVLTFALAVCSLSAFASCGSSSDSSSKVVDKKLKEDQQQIVQRLADDMKDVRDLKSNEIKWFSHWDINPTEAEDKEIGADLALFKTKYNGKINWVQTTWETKFDDLAALVMSNDSPDFIGADDMDVFPKGAIKSMIEPIDDYIDLSKPLWTDIKGATDQFMLGDKHYVSVIRTDPAYVFVYNKQTMEDNGYDDPAELFKEGKWNWDTFTEMCLDFTDAESDKYALDGWYYDNNGTETKWNFDTDKARYTMTLKAKWTKNTTPIIPGNGTNNIVEQYKTDDSSSGEQTDREVPSPVVKNATSYMTYTVQTGDTLWKIARKYNCSITEIMAANSDRIKNPNRIHAGWQLKIPQSGAPITGGTPDAVLPENKKSGIYIVRQGDTLWKIARKYNCSVAEIVSLNRELIRDPALIYSGWELKVPQN